MNFQDYGGIKYSTGIRSFNFPSTFLKGVPLPTQFLNSGVLYWFDLVKSSYMQALDETYQAMSCRMNTLTHTAAFKKSCYKCPCKRSAKAKYQCCEHKRSWSYKQAYLFPFDISKIAPEKTEKANAKLQQYVKLIESLVRKIVKTQK